MRARNAERERGRGEGEEESDENCTRERGAGRGPIGEEERGMNNFFCRCLGSVEWHVTVHADNLQLQ